jgi:hypothetical protein
MLPSRDEKRTRVFGLLSVYEIAALAKKYNALTESSNDFTEKESELRSRLKNYIGILSDEKSAEIEHFYLKIKL